MSSSVLFTCLTCKVGFYEAQLQRDHYKSEWHLYNLKRKVAELSPLSQEDFENRLRDFGSQTPSVDGVFVCSLCPNKKFASQNAFDNHVQSRRHKALLAQSVDRRLNQGADKVALELEGEKMGVRSDRRARSNDTDRDDTDAATETTINDEDSDEYEFSDDDDTLALEECLFCTNVADSLEDNVAHMGSAHCFFIPDVEFLSNLAGLISYLGVKVGHFHQCLWCASYTSAKRKSKQFSDLKAVQRHMMDKGHTAVRSDADAMLELDEFYCFDQAADDEPVSFDLSEATGQSEDGMEPMELVLPSGATVGHRSLRRYFKQYIRPDKQLVAVNRSRVNNVVAHYRRLGWTGTTGEAAKRKARDQVYVQRLRAKHWLHSGVKANRLQHHFRPDVTF